MTINEQLKRLRKEQKLSQKDVAERLGCHYVSVLNFEKNKHKWNQKRISDYAELLGYKLENQIKLIKL